MLSVHPAVLVAAAEILSMLVIALAVNRVAIARADAVCIIEAYYAPFPLHPPLALAVRAVELALFVVVVPAVVSVGIIICLGMSIPIFPLGLIRVPVKSKFIKFCYPFIGANTRHSTTSYFAY